MVEMLDTWLGESTTHFNIFVGVTMAVVVIALLTMVYLRNKIGKSDERTNVIYLKVSNTMLVVMLVLLAVFIAWVDKNTVYFRQLLIAIIALTLGSGAISLAVFARKSDKKI